MAREIDPFGRGGAVVLLRKAGLVVVEGIAGGGRGRVLCGGIAECCIFDRHDHNEGIMRAY